ncbi:RimJ/RimL family protein N-acetyltransferase [Kitasatospora sp. MAP12-15]|uniref:GNAT family N-acetyltransferase n=1 Tax=unclassified Kitasatospora TaxID=2633591 RepID=UPI002473B1B8|nr:GNAT family N-acetyltransferase [Kitasatospora sp. MAP12-44]MDH6108491.1 RimJ/RimL family protein N-acetyltransferase [Kitasatospora sp. MAP12-44]
MTAELRSAELTLCPWAEEHAGQLVAAAADPLVRQNTSMRVSDHAQALSWIAWQQEEWAAGERYAFAVLDTAGEVLLGHVVLKRPAKARARGSAEIGYWTAAHARGRAVAPRAVEAVTAWTLAGHAGPGVSRLELLHQVGNDASCRVAEKTGYLLESVMPAHPPTYPQDGHLHVRLAERQGWLATHSYG